MYVGYTCCLERLKTKCLRSTTLHYIGASECEWCMGAVECVFWRAFSNCLSNWLRPMRYWHQPNCCITFGTWKHEKSGVELSSLPNVHATVGVDRCGNRLIWWYRTASNIKRSDPIFVLFGSDPSMQIRHWLKSSFSRPNCELGWRSLITQESGVPQDAKFGLTRFAHQEPSFSPVSVVTTTPDNARWTFKTTFSS